MQFNLSRFIVKYIVIIIKNLAYFIIVFAEKFVKLKLPGFGAEDKIVCFFYLQSLNSGHKKA
jgi:hypothetical protein